MDSLNNILLKKDFDEPPEIAAIKRYVKTKFQSEVGVAVQPSAITITAASSSLAGTLRLHTVQLQKAASTKKKLIFRIG